MRTTTIHHTFKYFVTYLYFIKSSLVTVIVNVYENLFLILYVNETISQVQKAIHRNVFNTAMFKIVIRYSHVEVSSLNDELSFSCYVSHMVYEYVI